MSARTYTQFSGEEFEDFLGEFAVYTEAQNTGADERVFDIPLPDDNLSIRVFSTLQDGAARDLGTDAVRTVIWNHEHEAPVGGRTKTLRIQTWRSNLRRKIEDLAANWRDHNHGDCPVCGRGVMALREGKYGEFLGCTNYPNCTNTQNI